MQEKKTSWIYKVICFFVRLFTPRYRVLGAENLPDGPCVIVGNHSQMLGPIAGELHMPGKPYIWCAGEMMVWKEVHAYAYKDFWSGKPKAIRWFYRLLSYLITPLSVCVFNNARTVPVYHDTRLITAYRRSIELLREGRSILIFPECYEKHNNIVHNFQDKFIDLARFYYKKTGETVSFVPVYLAPKLGTMSFGAPLPFDPKAPIADERRRLCGALMDAITDMAVAQPLHTVIPYPNIPKRLYPKNLPLEVYANESAEN